MLFLVDECTGPNVANWLRAQGHDVFSAYDSAQGKSDNDLLSRAISDSRIIITNDKDFGEMIFRERRDHCGVIFLRLADERSKNKIAVLERLLASYSERLAGNFVTVTETRVRFA